MTIGWDTSKVYAFSANENEAWKRATDAWNANAITLAQFCQECELEEPKEETGKKYKNEMTTPPQLQSFAGQNNTPADGTPDKNPAQQEGAAMSDEMDNARDQEEIKTITNLLTEIKAIRAEMKT